MSVADDEIEPAAEMVLQDMVDEYICRGTDIYQFARDVFLFGLHAAIDQSRCQFADEVIYDWEKDDTRGKS